jgi:hypothetical protein
MDARRRQGRGVGVQVTAAPPLDQILEKEWTSQVVQLARTLGWLRYHTHLSKRSASGFPDEVLVRERVVFLELKREKTKLSPDQKSWVGDLLAAGAEVYVARPRDLQKLGLILASRGQPRDSGGEASIAAWALQESTRRDVTA